MVRTAADGIPPLQTRHMGFLPSVVVLDNYFRTIFALPTKGARTDSGIDIFCAELRTWFE